MDELEHVIESLARLHELLTPCPVPDLGQVVDDPGYISEFAWWSRLRADPSALEPPPPGLPTLRAFQDAQGRAARRMLAERLGNR